MFPNQTVLVKANPTRITRTAIVVRPSRERTAATLLPLASEGSETTRPATPIPKVPSHLPSVAANSEVAGTRKQIELSPSEAASNSRRMLQRRFDAASRDAQGQARLRKADIYETIKLAYAAVRAWKRRGVAGEIKRLLRREASVTIAVRSSPFLVLLRSALPNLDAKRASKWAAAMELADRKDIAGNKFVSFVEAQGGIEGAARKLARLRTLAAEGGLR